jgi:cell division septation protein DedD
VRDGNRLKEKIELRLDQRQVVSFVMVALVLAGAIFALGVLVGKNLASMPNRTPPTRNEDLLARLDENAKAGPAARAVLDGGPDGLTFQEELTRPEVGEKKAPKVAEKRPAVKPVNPPKTDAGVSVAVAHLDAGSAVPTSILAPPPTTIGSGGPFAAQPSASAAPGGLPPLRPVGGTPPDPAASQMLAHPLRPSPTPTPVPTSSFFTVQVKATQSKDDADRFVAKLEGSGYHPFVAEVDLAAKGHWYRVRVGKFETRPKAEQYLADFKRETHLEAFVTAAGH